VGTELRPIRVGRLRARLDHDGRSRTRLPGAPGRPEPRRGGELVQPQRAHPADSLCAARYVASDQPASVRHAIGGNGELPTFWELIDEYVTTQWADCDEGRIASAASDFSAFASTETTAATTLWSEVTGVFTATEIGSPEIHRIVDEVAAVCRGFRDIGHSATALAAACKEVDRVAAIDKSYGRTSLKILRGIITSYEIDKIGTYAVPFGWLIRRQLDQLIDANKRAFAQGMDGLMQGINKTVDTAAKSNTGIYDLATGSSQQLASILDRTPRQTKPVRNRTRDEDIAAGAEGERRAGIPPGAPKRAVEVTVDGKRQLVIPDWIDDENQHVTEVKNTNEIRPSADQIVAEAE
jgi:hypothetical protein